MRRPKTLQAFSETELVRAHRYLASRVATMMGRKFEEGDWSYTYCSAKNIPDEGWSNLHIDIMHESLGVEHKMLCIRSNRAIKEYCGTRLMHPAATRAIRIPSTEGDPTEIAREIFDVPAPNDPNLYHLRVQGEPVENELIRLWITATTALILQNVLGTTDADTLSAAIIEQANKIRARQQKGVESTSDIELAKPIFITKEAYNFLTQAFRGVSDEHRMQIFVQYLSR